MLIKLFILGALSSLTMLAFAQQDPTRPPSVIAQQLTPLQKVNAPFNVSAIFTRNDRRYAVVNGQVLKQGDEILGMKVSGIEASNVTLSDLTSSANDIVLQVQNNAGMSKQVVK
ncbi:hypothetical protein ACFO4O_12960 [Glaciecola siphonariae]|uniref:MSHA biogenesis protein MshK n=1 Tax=Glaciecola siphonariae TaxID=521012 RepID=A0ABV9LWY3_9ALTE